jgi:hypothetical protein
MFSRNPPDSINFPLVGLVLLLALVGCWVALRPVDCPDCYGVGTMHGGEATVTGKWEVPCPVCRGTKRMAYSRALLWGMEHEYSR